MDSAILIRYIGARTAEVGVFQLNHLFRYLNIASGDEVCTVLKRLDALKGSRIDLPARVLIDLTA